MIQRRKAVELVAAIAIVILLSPILVVALGWILIEGLGLRAWFWRAHYRRGRDVVVVYSESPKWKLYFESQIIPRLEGRSVVLNWSERRDWPEKYPWETRYVRRFAGDRGFNPCALVFLPNGRIKRVSFFDAFRDLKHGNPNPLQEAEYELFRLIPAAA